jgi:predicted permease
LGHAVLLAALLVIMLLTNPLLALIYVAVIPAGSALLLLIMKQTNRLFRRQNEDRRRSLRYSIICSNAGFLGNPIAEGVFGGVGLMFASIYLIPQRIMMWSEAWPFIPEKRTGRKPSKMCFCIPA